MPRAALAATIAATLTIAAPAAPAHAGEAGYLARLAVDYDYQVTAETTPAALKAGYLLCSEMRRGTPRERLADAVFLAIPNATRAQADGMAYAAQRELCPDTAE